MAWIVVRLGTGHLRLVRSMVVNSVVDLRLPGTVEYTLSRIRCGMSLHELAIDQIHRWERKARFAQTMTSEVTDSRYWRELDLCGKGRVFRLRSVSVRSSTFDVSAGSALARRSRTKRRDKPRNSAQPAGDSAVSAPWEDGPEACHTGRKATSRMLS